MKRLNYGGAVVRSQEGSWKGIFYETEEDVGRIGGILHGAAGGWCDGRVCDKSE